MRDKKFSRPAGGTAGAGRAETAAFGEAAISCSNSSTSLQKVQSIFDLLPQGERNSIPSKELAELVVAPSVRELQNRIAAEREQGKLILSTCRNGGGYFRPSPGAEGRAEIERYISTLKARALNTLKILWAAKAAVASSELAGQIDLDELGVM